jgi:hypothetical protein
VRGRGEVSTKGNQTASRRRQDGRSTRWRNRNGRRSGRERSRRQRQIAHLGAVWRPARAPRQFGQADQREAKHHQQEHDQKTEQTGNHLLQREILNRLRHAGDRTNPCRSDTTRQAPTRFLTGSRRDRQIVQRTLANQTRTRQVQVADDQGRWLRERDSGTETNKSLPQQWSGLRQTKRRIIFRAARPWQADRIVQHGSHVC